MHLDGRLSWVILEDTVESQGSLKVEEGHSWVQSQREIWTEIQTKQWLFMRNGGRAWSALPPFSLLLFPILALWCWGRKMTGRGWDFLAWWLAGLSSVWYWLPIGCVCGTSSVQKCVYMWFLGQWEISLGLWTLLPYSPSPTVCGTFHHLLLLGFT